LFWSDLDYDLKQGAAFGEATVSVTPEIDLTAGLRYYNFKENRQQIFDGIFGNNFTGDSSYRNPAPPKPAAWPRASSRAIRYPTRSP